MKPGQSTYFDYDLQVWIVDGIVQDCGHTRAMKVNGPCCNQNKLAGQRIDQIKTAEELTAETETRNNYQATADQCFDQAIRDGRLSTDPKTSNYAGNYMYMGKQGDRDLFKNIDTRHYDV